MIQFKKIPYVRYIPIIIITLVLFRVVNNIENVGDIVNKIFSLLSYFIWGFVIAYLLNPLMVYLENKTKIERNYIIALIYTVFVGLILLTLTLVTPSVIKSAVDIFNNMPTFINKTYTYASDLISSNKYLKQFNITSSLETYLSTITDNISSYFTPGLQLIINKLMGLSSLFMKLLSGIVISVYFLKDKESILLTSKKLTYSIFSTKYAEHLIRIANIINNIFNKYFVGKILDSIIFGVISFIGAIILQIPYPLPISILIGITNMIPYFGNIIGLIPSCIITIFFSPVKTLEFIIFIVTLSTIDGWFISPKILGDRIGLSPLLIILGIAVGGGLFGIVGMFLGVPTVALIKTLLDEYMDKNLKIKGIEISDTKKDTH